MRHRMHVLTLTAVFLLLFASFGWAAPRVAVMDFDNKSQHGGWRVGRGAADILTTELVKVQKFEMFERGRLNTVLKEQDFGASGRVDPATAAKIGKVIGVNYIITGSVTEYGQSKSGGGGGGVRVGKIGYHATVDIRMVDAITGRILFADSGSASKKSVSVRVFGFGGGSSFNEKAATEALRMAIQDLAKKITELDLKASKTGMGAAASGSAAKALVADVDGTTITLNKGTNAGFKKGQKLTVKRQGKVIKDPSTGKVIKVKYKTIGSIQLTEVEDSYSEGRVVKGAGFKVGDRVQ